MCERNQANERLAHALWLINKHLKPYLYSKAHRTRAVTADNTRWKAFTTAVNLVEQSMEVAHADGA